jgi:hypothetical protein
VSVAAVGSFPQEGFQMFADDGVEDRVLGVARLIRAMGVRHARAASGGNAQRWIHGVSAEGRARLPMVGPDHFSAAEWLWIIGLCKLRVSVASCS